MPSQRNGPDFEDSPHYDTILQWARDVYARQGLTISPDAVILPCRDHAAVQAWLTVPYTLRIFGDAYKTKG